MEGAREWLTRVLRLTTELDDLRAEVLQLRQQVEIQRMVTSNLCDSMIAVQGVIGVEGDFRFKTRKGKK